MKQNPTFSTGRALVIGVANYVEVGSLPEAVLNDARDLSDILTSVQHCGYLQDNVKTLLDEQATLENILSGLDWLATSSQPHDIATVYFSGHGALLSGPPNVTSSLIPFDCSPTSIATTSLTEADFSKALKKIPAQRLLVLIDACHAGAAGSLKVIDNNLTLGFSEKSLEKLAQGSGRVLIASSRASEYSNVMPGARNSVFTQALLEALRGTGTDRGDGFVRVFDVFNYVAASVKNQMGGTQTPIFKANDVEENFPVALEQLSLKNLNLSSVTAGMTSDDDSWRQLNDILSELYPQGPTEQDVWLRAGGDLSRLKLSGTGRSTWFSALRTLRQGGGGVGIRRATLTTEVLSDYPHHIALGKLK